MHAPLAPSPWHPPAPLPLPVRSLVGAPLRARGKRKAIRLTDQSHVNTGKHSHIAGRTADVNCALCTTAGAINLLQKRRLWTTGMVAEAVGSTDGKAGMGAESVAQAKGIKTTVVALGGAKTTGEVGGAAVGKEVALGTALTWMKKQPTGTVFAILVSGSFVDGGGGHHWLNAERVGKGDLVFHDFQSDKTRTYTWEEGTVTTGTTPFHGISGGIFRASSKAYAVGFRRS